MHTEGKLLAIFRSLFSGTGLSGSTVVRTPLFVTAARYSTICLNQVDGEAEECVDSPKATSESFRERNQNQNTVESVGEAEQLQVREANSVDVLRRWGCTENDISKLLLRRPVLLRADAANLESKLILLRELGITSSDLVKIVNCRPRFLSCCIKRCFDERIKFFMTFFGSREVLRKAIIRNPSLMTYDLGTKIKPVIEVYKGMGLTREDLIPMLLSRPTLISRTNFNDEKMEYIRRTGVTKESKMFKYVASLIGVSRIETIQEKVANIEKFGFSEEEVWHMIGKSPLILTLSVDKVQRNMTFIVASMKLPAHSVLNSPFLLYGNLESHIRPRVSLARRIEEMGLEPRIKLEDLLTVLRMGEDRFLRVYILRHPKEVAAELLEFYKKAKCMKRLAVASKKNFRRGFPF